MALGVPGFVKIGAALAGCALVAACIPEPGPTTTPTPAPTMTASPSASATPTETEIERQQREDWAAAEKAYLTAIDETQRLAGDGGANEASRRLKSVATAAYLDTTLNSLRTIKKQRWRLVGSISVVGIARSGGWSANRLTLVGCEDNSTWKMVDRTGKDVTPSDLTDYMQTLSAVKIGDAWKVSGVETKKLKQVSAEDCKA